MNKLLIISLLLIAFISLSAVSASDNTTDIQTADSTLKEVEDNIINNGESQNDEKQELNASIKFPDNTPKYSELNDYYYINIENLPQDYDQFIDWKIDNENFSSIYYREGIEVHPFKYSLGEHLITINLHESDKYLGKTINKTFNVCEVVINIPDEISALTPSANILIAPDATGTASVYVDGKLFLTKKIESEVYGTYINLRNMALGPHKVSIVYSGDKKYPKTQITKNVNVTYEIETVFYPETLYGNEKYIYIILPPKVTSKPIVTIGNETYIPNLVSGIKGEFELNLNKIKPGNHTINITYPGDKTYPKLSVFEKICVLTHIDINNIYGTSNVNLNLPEDASGNLTVYIDGKLYDTLPVRGNTFIYLKTVDVGRHNLQAFYTSDDYNVKIINRTMVINPSIENNAPLYPDKIPYIKIKMNPNANGTWTYYHDEGSGSFKVVNGEYTLKLPDIPFYIEEPSFLTLKYSDDNGYVFERELGFERAYYPIKITAKDITMYYCDGTTLKVKVLNEFKAPGDNNVKVKIGTKNYVQAAENGIATFKLTMNPGTYKVTITYNGEYRSATLNTKLTIKKILTLSTVKVKKSANKLVLTAKLAKKLKGKPITFKFNGKTYKTKTDAKGVAKVTIKSSVLKKLKIGKKLTYQATYVKDTVKKTVKVKK